MGLFGEKYSKKSLIEDSTAGEETSYRKNPIDYGDK